MAYYTGRPRNDSLYDLWLMGRQQDAAKAEAKAMKRQEQDQVLYERTRQGQQDVAAAEDTKFERAVRLAEMEGSGNAMQGTKSPTGYRDPRAQEAADIAYNLGTGKEAQLERTANRQLTRDITRQNMIRSTKWDDPNTQERVRQKARDLGISEGRAAEMVWHDIEQERLFADRTDRWDNPYSSFQMSTFGETQDAKAWKAVKEERLRELMDHEFYAPGKAQAEAIYREVQDIDRMVGSDPKEALRVWRERGYHAPGDAQQPASTPGPWAPDGAPQGAPGVRPPVAPAQAAPGMSDRASRFIMRTGGGQ